MLCFSAATKCISFSLKTKAGMKSSLVVRIHTYKKLSDCVIVTETQTLLK
jgi:hypothetical protein